jgi:hypothetical protein
MPAYPDQEILKEISAWQEKSNGRICFDRLPLTHIFII